MADQVDIASEVEELERSLRIAAATHKSAEPSPEFCECGRAIPLARRELLPGVQNCVICQEELERR
jgi:phage/conjugal plasmid C-4 type zinc finger TraR family protein